jgi:hypothetical protein
MPTFRAFVSCASLVFRALLSHFGMVMNGGDYDTYRARRGYIAEVDFRRRSIYKPSFHRAVGSDRFFLPNNCVQ